MAGMGSPQVLRKRNEDIQELIDHVQGKHLLRLLGASLARWLAPLLRRFVAQVGDPQGVQQGDHIGEQLSLYKSESKHGSTLDHCDGETRATKKTEPW